ncbi:NPC intracellular cholesterol transporter 2-like [Diorhabda sublineata]|uniref:NPC intracellular cholesterol transporter 2-like n=1 Tax=Diorhabda sublineata TaxID=1163346 RepID=UPI0024E1098A|nr:NPC intracellular cholesterol transporter 2-like [Diorhabda sublineata]
MKRTVLLVLVAVFFGSAAANNVKWRPCNSTAGIAKNVVVHGCDTEICPLKRGTNASLSITFESHVNAEKLTAIVIGEILTIPYKFNLPNPDSCQGVGIECPIKSGETYVYTNTIEVKTKYPRVTVDILWKLKDENEDIVMCVVIPARIVAAN